MTRTLLSWLILLVVAAITFAAGTYYGELHQAFTFIKHYIQNPQDAAAPAGIAVIVILLIVFLPTLFKRRGQPVKHTFRFTIRAKVFGNRVSMHSVAMMPQEKFVDAEKALEEEVVRAIKNAEYSITREHYFRREKEYLKTATV